MAQHHTDDDSRRLALQLQLEDLEALKRGPKGKQREGETSDFEVAMRLHEQHLEASAVLDEDRKMCRSIALAVQSDGPAIQSCQAEEEQARRDRLLARTLTTNGPIQSTAMNPEPPVKREPLDAGLLRRLEALNLARHQDPGSEGESSSWSETQKPAHGDKLETEECISCRDEHVADNMATCPCSHNYCRQCLNSLFEQATVDESLFPPRCCQKAIPLDEHQHLLAASLVVRFKVKAVEYSTQNRTYCYRPDCSAFVPPQLINGDVAACAQCGSKTCVMCKGAQHRRECPKDGATQAVLDMAKENGWQRCESCSRLVELNTGCHHITCICKAQFCYVCGKTWRTCECPWWTEARLTDRANVLADRDVNNRQLEGQQRAEVVRRAVNNIIRTHACVRHEWEFESGEHQCEECHDLLPTFIFECRNCQLMVCRRCRYNRL